MKRPSATTPAPLFAIALFLGLSLGGCDLLEPSEDGGSGVAPESIASKTMEFAGITLVFSSSTVRDPSGTDVPYSYSKTGESTASLTVRNSQVYANLGDAAYSLSFSSSSGGTLTQNGESTSFTLR